MKNTYLFLGALILAVTAFVIFSSRQIFFYKYEPEYFENLYYHSQWNYPNSTREISDASLYQFIGFRLAEGENPFDINFQIPPFGKHLYGLAEKYLGNPYWVSFFLYSTTIGVLFLLLKELFKKRQTILLAILLFVTTPFVATQIGQTMLDLPLMFLFLVHVWFFIKFLSNQKLANLVAAGIFLGLATGTKPGVYTPLAMALGLILVFLTTKKFFNLIFYSGSVFAGYVLAYFPTYFIRHPNPIPWLRLHEKPLKFYLGPGQPYYLNQWKGIFLNIYQGWWQPGQKMALTDWSPILPFGVIAASLVLIWAIKRQKKEWIYIAGLSFVFLIINTFTPFFPRYLMPAIPLFVLLISFLFRKVGFVILLLSLLNLPFLATSLATDDPTRDSQAVARFISTRAYRELYRSLPPEERESLPEEKFINLQENFLDQLGTRAVEVSVGEKTKTEGKVSFKYKIIYTTQYGQLSHEPTFDFVKVNNQWRLDWNWDYLWPGFRPESKIVINEKSIPFLRMEDERGMVIARRAKGKVVYAIPRLMFDWGKHLNALADVTDEYSEVDRRIKLVVPDQYPRFAGYLDPTLGNEGIDKALSIPGVSLKDIDYIVIPKNIASTEYVLRLVRDLQRKNPELFYVEAEVYIKNKDEKILIPFKKPDQKNVVIKL